MTKEALIESRRPRRRPSSRHEHGRFFVCLARGHRWDVAPRRGASYMRCLRCGMTAEPFTPR